MKDKPVLAFDTSALNHLADDVNREMCIASIQSSYEVRLPELATGEIYASRDFPRRRTLYDVCRELLNSGCCISPPHWLISNLVKSHHQAPTIFDWSVLPWRIRADEEQLREGTILGDEELATGQRENQSKNKKDFETGFKKGSNSTVDSTIWNDWVEREKENGGLLLIARNLYERALSYVDRAEGVPVSKKVEHDVEMLEEFVDSCPPFRALIYAYAMTAYDRVSTQKPSGEPKYNTGRNDQFMSVYLPYCDKFITADPAQELCLKEIARTAKLATEVTSYKNFRSRICSRRVPRASS